MPVSSFQLTLAESIVALAWLEREAIARDGANLGSTIVDRSELAALVALAPAVAASLAALGHEDIGPLLSAARKRLTPEETEFDIRTDGHDDSVLPDAAPADVDLDRSIEVSLPNQTLLVLFEFLCREIDERDGENLAGAFVCVAEFWALNAIQCMLEKGAFYSALRDYQAQLDEARATLRASN